MLVIARCIALCGILLVAGCWWKQPDRDPVDSDKFLPALTTALEAWKSGQAESLSARQPPIRFANDDWIAGRQLVDYQLNDPDAPVRPFETVYVTLLLRNAEGRTVQRVVGCQVSSKPGLAVLRSEP
jgi:hypothetical protein